MALPTFTEFIDAQTAYKAALGQDFFRQMQDDFTNLNGRVKQLEGAIALQDHFLSDGGGRFSQTSLDVQNGFDFDYQGIWRGQRQSGGTGNTTVALAYTSPASSILRLTTSDDGQSKLTIIRGLQEFVFNDCARPIIYKARLKWSDTGQPNHRYGLGSEVHPTGAYATPPNSGIFLEHPDNTNVRFVTRDNTAQLAGTPFARPAAGAWFQVKIEFTDTPSNRALCYIDVGAGFVLKETFTNTLPTSRRLFPMIMCGSNNGGWVEADRCEHSALAVNDAA